MDGEKLIQVSFQLPSSALDSLSRLAEQMRMLTETVAAQAAPVSRAAGSERGESDSFDPERFLALRQGTDMRPQAVHAEVSDIADAKTASAGISEIEDAKTVSSVASVVSRAEDAEPVSAGIRKELQDAEGAGETLNRPLEAIAATVAADGLQRASREERDPPLPPVETPQMNLLNQIPAVRAEAEEAVPSAPEARRDAEQQISGVESARAEAMERELALTDVQGEVSGGVESPAGAGVVVQTQPEMPQSHWSDVTEELVVPGPALLTAEAVSLAFERDGRRYDNGFPLY